MSVACNVAVALGPTAACTAVPVAEDQTRDVSRTVKEMSMSELAVVLDDDMLCCSKYISRCAVAAYEPELLR